MERVFHKTLIACLYVIASAASAVAQTTTENYVKSEVFINGSGGKVTTVQYYDGLGRPTLNATNSRGNNGMYVYTSRQYDYGDRITEQTIAAYGTASPVYNASLTWMNSDTHHSTTFTFDALDRPTAERGPGDLWHNNSRFRGTSYLLNSSNEVRLYTVTDNSLSQSSYYGEGKLFVEQQTDENNHVTKIYKYTQGRTVMELGNGNFYTYYV